MLLVPPPDAVDANPPASRGRRLLRVPVVLLGAAWFVVVPVLGLRALLRTMTFFGEQPTPAARADQHHQAAVALGVSAAVVAVGLGVSVLARSTAGGWVFALLVVPTLLLGMLWLDTVQPADPTGPGASSTSTTPVVVCQEHSGGGTRCPGG